MNIKIKKQLIVILNNHILDEDKRNKANGIETETVYVETVGEILREVIDEITDTDAGCDALMEEVFGEKSVLVNRI